MRRPLVAAAAVASALLVSVAALVVSANDPAAPNAGTAKGGRTIDAPAPSVVLSPFENWRAQEQRAHPLVGKIWGRAEGGLVTPRKLALAMQTADYLLLGEVHDNPDHHRIQAWGLAVRAAGKNKTTLVMEMIGADQVPALDSFYADFSASKPCCPENPAGALFDRLNWDKSGWPDRKIYRPIIDRALQGRIRIYPGSDTRKAIRTIGKTGFTGISAARQQALVLDKPLPRPLTDALVAELRDGHCGMLPERAIGSMTKVQRYRDGVMAEAMVRLGDPNGAVLIAGNGHVRADRAVPWYLRRMAAGKRIVTVMSLEVSAGETDIAGYIERDPDGRPAADYIILTPRQGREDQCEILRKMFKKKPRK